MNAELQFLTALQGLHTPARDAVMLFFTRLGNAGFVWIALAAILLLFRRTRRAGCILCATLYSATSSSSRWCTVSVPVTCCPR